MIPRIAVALVAAFAVGVSGAASATPSASSARVVVAAEQDVAGFNTSLTCCNGSWSRWMGAEEALRGAFVESPKGIWLPDRVSSASANGKGVTYVIKPSASWYWGGRRVPVTYRDFVYTLREIDAPDNDIATRAGYANLDPARYTHTGLRKVTFFWRRKGCDAESPCGPYGNWQSLFATLYPSFALSGLDFNRIWTNCICGADGRPVSDGPYYLASYTKGHGAILEANPFWSGRKPAIREVGFEIVTDPGAEVSAVSSGQVDVIAPTFGSYLASLKNVAGLAFDATSAYFVERLDFREGPGASNALLRAPFIRRAIAMAIDRNALLGTVYGNLADFGGVSNDALFYSTQAGYKPDFERWNAKPAIALETMKAHCTGGPRSVDPATTLVWSCSGLPATFSWSWPTGDVGRALSEAVAKEELRAVGIQIVDRPLAPDVFYGSAGIASGAYDLAELPQTTSGDPGDWYDTYACTGAANDTGFCSRKVEALLGAAARELDPARRKRDYLRADALLSRVVPVLPLYQRPTVVVATARLAGLVNNPGAAGPFWNVESWTWRKR